MLRTIGGALDLGNRENWKVIVKVSDRMLLINYIHEIQIKETDCY